MKITMFAMILKFGNYRAWHYIFSNMQSAEFFGNIYNKKKMKAKFVTKGNFRGCNYSETKNVSLKEYIYTGITKIYKSFGLNEIRL